MSSSTKKAPSCPICLGHFTKVIRQPVACPYCPSKTCRTCTQQYLLNTMNDPHCHSCKREWNREFIDTHLTQTFRKGPLRQQRRKILMDRETGRLPAMQIFVEAQIIYDRTGRRSYLLAAERKKIKAERHVAQLSFEPGSLSAAEVTALMAPFALRLAENRKALDANYILYNNAMMVLTGRSTEAPRQFVMKCPGEECRGFLSSAWKCGTCQKSFCPDCHARKQSHKDEEHVCEADAKATASMISKETRPCPKCGIRISKIDGCFAKDTPILLWDGSMKMSQEIKVGDSLVGDDGEIRVVQETCSGEDEMYEVTQKHGLSYTVNSKHKLVLKCDPTLSKSIDSYTVRWLDENTLHMRTSKISFNKEDSEIVFQQMNDFMNTLPNTFEIPVDTYMGLSELVKKNLFGFKSTGVNWPKKDVRMDPYLVGLYLGDGIVDGISYAVCPQRDPEILQYLLSWCEDNECEVVHDAAYRFRIRRRGVEHGRLAIQHGATTAECKGCAELKCDLCDLPEKSYTDSSVKSDKNPHKTILDSYSLLKNKHIPQEFIVNDRETRLQLLAGLIDTDGYLGSGGKRIEIPQSNHTLARQIEFLAQSLGLTVHVNTVKKKNIRFGDSEAKDYPDHLKVNISGNGIQEIPCRVLRKKCFSLLENDNTLISNIQVKGIGRGTYFGWSVNSNKRFVLHDFTTLRNCDQMWCTGCHTTFSWNSGQILLNTITHNPHYYEYLRKANNGEIPREAGDVPCGGLPHAWQFSRMILDLSISTIQKTTILECLRCLSDLVDVRLPRFPSRQAANANQAADIQYLTNKLTKDEWGVILERTENTFEKGKEIGLILQTLVHVGSEKMALIHNVATPSALKRKLEREAMIPGILADMEKVRDFTNRSLWAKGLQMGAVVPHISKEWAYVWIRKSDMKNPVYIDDRPADAAATVVLVAEGEAEAEAPVAAPVAAAPVAAAPVEVDVDAEVEGEEMIYVELQNGELVQMPLTQARQLIFVERTAALIGI